MWMWPNARISVMGGEQAANVLLQVKQDQLRHKGQPVMSDEESEAFKEPILKEYDERGHPFFASARLWDDGIINLTETRQALALGISMSLNAPIPEYHMGVFRM